MLQKTVFLDRDGTINEEVSYLHKVEDFRFLPGVVEGMKRLYDSGFSLVVLTNQAGIGRGYYTEKDAENVHRFMREALAKEGVALSGIYYCPHHPEAIPPYKVDCPCRKPKAGLFYQAEWDLLLREKEKGETPPGKSVESVEKVERRNISDLSTALSAPVQSAYTLSAKERAILERENQSSPERKDWLSASYMIGDKLLDCEAGLAFGVHPILLGTGYGAEEREKAKKEGKPAFLYFPSLLEAVDGILVGKNAERRSDERIKKKN